MRRAPWTTSGSTPSFRRSGSAMGLSGCWETRVAGWPLRRTPMSGRATVVRRAPACAISVGHDRRRVSQHPSAARSAGRRRASGRAAARGAARIAGRAARRGPSTTRPRWCSSPVCSSIVAGSRVGLGRRGRAVPASWRSLARRRLSRAQRRAVFVVDEGARRRVHRRWRVQVLRARGRELFLRIPQHTELRPIVTVGTASSPALAGGRSGASRPWRRGHRSPAANADRRVITGVRRCSASSRNRGSRPVRPGK